MSTSLSLMPDYVVPNNSLILGILPNYSVSSERAQLHLQQKIDLILLSLEALEMGSSDFIFDIAKQLELDHLLKNRLVLWRMRCTNSWRRSYTHDTLNTDQAKALVIIASRRARQLTVTIRQLLVAQQQMEEKNLPLGTNYLLSEYLEQFRSYFRSRMNPRRTKIAWYLEHEEELNQLALTFLSQLLFSTGTLGTQRLWTSLFDGEIKT
jgi:hypothetical protein